MSLSPSHQLAALPTLLGSDGEEGERQRGKSGEEGGGCTLREFRGGVSVYDKEEEQGKVEDGEVGGEEVWWVARRGGVSLHSRLLALPLENNRII